MPGRTKIGTEVGHVTPDSDTTLKVQSSTVNLQGAGAYCGGQRKCVTLASDDFVATSLRFRCKRAPFRKTADKQNCHRPLLRQPLISLIATCGCRVVEWQSNRNIESWLQLPHNRAGCRIYIHDDPRGVKKVLQKNHGS